MEFTNHKYTYTKPFGSPRHNWEVVGPNGAIHFHASLTEGYSPNCGLEIHYCYPPEYMKDRAPSHVDCKLTGGRCWHDGTSLYASETLWPIFSAYLKYGEHDLIFKALEGEYKDRFAGHVMTVLQALVHVTPAAPSQDAGEKT